MYMESLAFFTRVARGEGDLFANRYFWHTAKDKYVLFLAEFFLRRTNRSTVSRNLASFLERFPTAEILAVADPASVVEHAYWAGLMRRTAQLPFVMRRLMERHFWSASDLETLPYIGKYAAEAIALYVYDQEHFPVDNNVRRVIARYFGALESQQFNQAVGAVFHYAYNERDLNVLKATHMGVLGIGWDWCRQSPQCGGCPLTPKCSLSNNSVAGNAAKVTIQ